MSTIFVLREILETFNDPGHETFNHPVHFLAREPPETFEDTFNHFDRFLPHKILEPVEHFLARLPRIYRPSWSARETLDSIEHL
jgi:hypothetical protein